MKTPVVTFVLGGSGDSWKMLLPVRKQISAESLSVSATGQLLLYSLSRLSASVSLRQSTPSSAEVVATQELIRGDRATTLQRFSVRVPFSSAPTERLNPSSVRVRSI